MYNSFIASTSPLAIAFIKASEPSRFNLSLAGISKKLANANDFCSSGDNLVGSWCTNAS